MRRAPAVTFCIALIMAVVLGCGSGSNSPGGGTTITPAQRMASLKAVFDRISTLTGADIPARRAEMLAYLKSRPEFEASGNSGDGGLWARFTDGRLFVLIANEELPSRGTREVPMKGRSAPAELPVNPQAHVSVGFGPTDTNTAEASVQALLAGGGYNILSRTGSIDDLKRVADLGVMFHQAHGGLGEDRQGNGVFTVTSSTIVTDAKEAQLLDDWQNDRLAYCGVTDYSYLVYPQHNTYYGIRPQFVRDYMNFSKESMVFIAACGSASPASADFRKAFQDKKAGAYFGWTRPVLRTDSNAAAKYLIDRLLGANTQSPVESPKQRPFDYFALKADLTKHNLDHSNGPNGLSELMFFAGTQGESGVLAPTIKFMDMEEHSGVLTLTGKFGTDQGEVKVNGTSVGIKSWAKEKIEVNLPLTGGQSSGNVQVIHRNVKATFVS